MKISSYKTSSSMSSRPSRRRATAPVFPTLATGIQNGLRRLVKENQATVARMLDCDADKSVDELCEKCAAVMKQQQLSASSFLARFFDVSVLSNHAVMLNKSGKGTAPTLAERIAGEWAKNRPIVASATATTAAGTATDASNESKPSPKGDRKRKDEEKASTPSVAKKAKASAKTKKKPTS